MNRTLNSSEHALDIWRVTFFQVGLPLLCLLGLCGNAMGLLLIRTNYNLKKLPSNVYLAALATGSSLFLFSALLMWVEMVTGLSLYQNSTLGCKLLTYMAHVCDFVCVWMICLVCFDRAVVLFRPGWRRTLCTLATAYRATLATTLFSILLYCWCLFLANVVPRGASTECGVSPDHRTVYTAFITIDTVVCTVLPCLLVIVVNGLAVQKYRACRRLSAQGLRVRFRHSSQFSEKALLGGREEHCTATIENGQDEIRESDRRKLLKPADLHLTKILLLVSSAFVCLNLPNYGVRIFRALFWHFDAAILRFLEFIFYIMYYSHHAVIFYLYIFWSPQMKKQLRPTAVKLLECYCLKGDSER